MYAEYIIHIENHAIYDFAGLLVKARNTEATTSRLTRLNRGQGEASRYNKQEGKQGLNIAYSQANKETKSWSGLYFEPNSFEILQYFKIRRRWTTRSNYTHAPSSWEVWTYLLHCESSYQKTLSSFWWNTDKDYLTPYYNNNLPLYVDAIINGVSVRRALIDNGASINSMTSTTLRSRAHGPSANKSYSIQHGSCLNFCAHNFRTTSRTNKKFDSTPHYYFKYLLLIATRMALDSYTQLCPIHSPPMYKSLLQR